MNAPAKITPDAEAKKAATSEGMVVSGEELDRLFAGDRARARRELRMLLRDLRDRELINGPTKRPSNVRLAEAADEEALWEFANIAYRDNGYMFAPLNPDKVIEAIRICTRHQGGICAVIDAADGSIAASMLCVPYQWWWSEQFFLQDLWTYVRPEFRKTSAADDVSLFMKWAADQWSAKNGYTVYVLAGIMSVNRPREKVRFYRKHYNEIGALGIYPAPPGMVPN